MTHLYGAGSLASSVNVLWIWAQGGQLEIPLFAERTDVFFVAAESPETLHFQVDASGRATGIDSLTSEGWRVQLKKCTRELTDFIHEF